MVLDEHRLLHVLWCDDIRQEVGNKPSFMGVYHQLGVQSVPMVLPRLSAFITVYSPINRPLSNLTVRVVKSDQEAPLAEFSMPANDLAQLVEQPNLQLAPGEDPVSVAFVSVAALLGNIQINESTRWLKVIAHAEEEMLESLKLRIIRAPGQVAENAEMNGGTNR